VIPDGDRRHGTESGDVVREIERAIERDEHVVGEFVLRDDLLDPPGRSSSPAPLEDAL